jgi:hypothetical protein
VKISRELTEAERHELVKTISSPGWGIIKDELERRRMQLAKDIIYSTDRSKDVDRRAGIVVIDMILGTEAMLDNPIEDEQPYQIYGGNRY